MKYLLFILVACTVCSCQYENTEKINTDADHFRLFLKKFKPVDLPFIFRYGTEGDILEFDKMPSMDAASSDTIHLKADDFNGIKCYGMLKDTTKFFSLIYFFPADSYYPMLVTYDKQGNIIDQTSLIVNGCGADCGLEYCSETGIIHKDLSITCVDTVKWKFSCDSSGSPIPDSDIVWVDTKTGKIKDNGKLLMHKKLHNTFRDSI